LATPVTRWPSATECFGSGRTSANIIFDELRHEDNDAQTAIPPPLSSPAAAGGRSGSGPFAPSVAGLFARHRLDRLVPLHRQRQRRQPQRKQRNGGRSATDQRQKRHS